MAMIRYEPWNMLRQIQQDIDRVFGPGGTLRAPEEGTPDSPGQWLPAVDLREDDSNYYVKCDLPGVAPEDIEVTVDNGALTIKGNREEERTEGEGAWRRVERARGTFFRRFALPEEVDDERIEARSRNGVLEVTVPKRAEVTAKRIEVATE